MSARIDCRGDETATSDRVGRLRTAELSEDMELSPAIDFARANRQSVLIAIRGNGRPQLSNVAHSVFDDGVIRISITADRAKYANLRREPWAATPRTSRPGRRH